MSDARELPGGLWTWLRKRVLSFGVVLALGFLLVVSMTLATALQVLFARLPLILPVLGNLTSVALYSAAFALLYRYLPDRHVRWRQAFVGGVLTAGLFVLGRWAIGLYLAQAAPGSAYGQMGTLVLLLVWMYYAAAVFFVGVNLLFFPMHFLGLQGQPRRYPDYQDGLAYWNHIASDYGYTLMAIGMGVFFVNILWSLFAGRKAPDNPWGEGATTLEWTLSSPPPYHQFETLPVIDEGDAHHH